MFFKNCYRRCHLLVRRYPLLPFLLAVTVAVDAVITFRLREGHEGPPWGPDAELLVYSSLAYGTFLAQYYLLGYWAIHSRSNISIRLLLSVGSIPIIFFLDEREAYLESNYFMPIAISVYLGSILMNGLYLKSKFSILGSFKVINLIQITTAVAIFLRVSLNANWEEFFDSESSAIDSTASSLLLGTVIVQGAKCFKRWMHLFLLVSIALGIAFYISCHFQLNYDFYFLLMLLSIVSYCGMSLAWSYGLQVRRRPIRHRKKKQQATPNESEQPVALKVVNPIEPPDEPTGPIDLTV